MGCRVINADGKGDSQGAVLYCSTTGWAFGPVFDDGKQAHAFLDWIGYGHHVGNRFDPRALDEEELEGAYFAFLEETKGPESVDTAECRAAIKTWRRLLRRRGAGTDDTSGGR